MGIQVCATAAAAAAVVVVAAAAIGLIHEHEQELALGTQVYAHALAGYGLLGAQAKLEGMWMVPPHEAMHALRLAIHVSQSLWHSSPPCGSPLPPCPHTLCLSIHSNHSLQLLLSTPPASTSLDLTPPRRPPPPSRLSPLLLPPPPAPPPRPKASFPMPSAHSPIRRMSSCHSCSLHSINRHSSSNLLDAFCWFVSCTHYISHADTHPV